MDNTVDRYDVENMLRDHGYELRRYVDDAIRRLARELRAELATVAERTDGRVLDYRTELRDALSDAIRELRREVAEQNRGRR